jgi:hypothetical protein
MSLALLVAVTALLVLAPALVDRVAVPRSAPTLVVTLATLRLVGLAVVPLALAASVAQLAGGGDHRHLGWPDVIAITAMATVGGRAAAAWHQTRQHAKAVAAAVAATATPGPRGSLLVPHDAAVAFTTDSQIVLTTGLLERLAPDELDAVLAHEDAHLRGGHARIAAAAHTLAAAAWRLPPARAAHARILEQLELLADHHAASTLNDTAPVYAAVAKLDREGPSTALGRGGRFTATRLGCLDNPLPSSAASDRVLRATIVLVTAGLIATVCSVLPIPIASVALAACGLLAVGTWWLLAALHPTPARLQDRRIESWPQPQAASKTGPIVEHKGEQGGSPCRSDTSTGRR